MSIRRLLKLVPPPKTPKSIGTEADWRRKEILLGISLPRQYLEVCQAYGSGWFQTVAGSRVDLINLFDDNIWRTIKFTVEGSESIKARRPELFKNGELIYLWASGFDCLSFCFVLGAGGESRILVYVSDYDEFQFYETSLVDFCVQMFSAKLDFGIVRANEFDGGVAFREILQKRRRQKKK
jgi:hypothetical protein